MDRFVNVSVHKSQNGQKHVFKWLTVVASSEQWRQSMVVVGPKIHSRHQFTWPTEVCGYPYRVIHRELLCKLIVRGVPPEPLCTSPTCVIHYCISVSIKQGGQNSSPCIFACCSMMLESRS